MKLTISQLRNQYAGEGQLIIEIKSREEAQNLIKSKTTTCWGNGRIDDTGWTQLSVASPLKPGDEQIIFVCKNELLNDKYSSIDDVIKDIGLKKVIGYTRQQNGVPSYCNSSKEAFKDFCNTADYGGMKLADKVVEWANQGEIKKCVQHTR